MADHSVISSSATGIWGKPGGCTGYPLMQQMFPEDDSEESREGTAAHEIAEEIVAGDVNPRPDSYVGRVASNGVVFTEDMFEGALEFAMSMFERWRSGVELQAEQRVHSGLIHVDAWGTCDGFIWDPENFALVVGDFKFGRVAVEAFENWQGINYAIGLLEKFVGPPGPNGDNWRDISVTILIVQPRAWHVDGVAREWETSGQEIAGFIPGLVTAAVESLGPNGVFRTGAHCKNCPGRHACGAALNAGNTLFEAATAAVPVHLEPDAMGAQLALVQRALKQLEALESGYAESLKATLRGGAAVAGWMVVEGQGRERWTVDDAEVIAMGELSGISLGKPPKAVTPKQAKKLGVDEGVIKQYSIKPSTGLKVVPDNGNRAKQVFSK